ncbi:MAG: hypothetical protein ABI873_10115 [Marmoricola sp.]
MRHSMIRLAAAATTLAATAACSTGRAGDPADAGAPTGHRNHVAGTPLPSGLPSGHPSGHRNHVAGTPLPSGFPPEVPPPPGRVIGASTGSGRWSVLLEVSGSAADVQRSSVAFYVQEGFHRESTSSVQGRGYRIMMIAENRDHSATVSALTVVVNRLPR